MVSEQRKSVARQLALCRQVKTTKNFLFQKNGWLRGLCCVIWSSETLFYAIYPKINFINFFAVFKFIFDF